MASTFDKHIDSPMDQDRGRIVGVKRKLSRGQLLMQHRAASEEKHMEINRSSVEDSSSGITAGARQDESVGRMDQHQEIVISGISGKFPESQNLAEFQNNLFQGIDMISDDERRWTRGFYGSSTKSGKLKDLTRFDAQFFSVHAKQANAMDPQLRLLHELTFEALLDAGVNPASIRGSRTGVYVGLMSSESEVAWSQDPDKCTGYEVLGCVRSMIANRLSYSFDLKGPSLSLDTACSSALMGLELAVRAIRAGHIDAAIIGGVNLCLDPIKTLQYTRLGMLSPDGRCKSFDASANGYVRSEAAAVIFIQRKSAALRSYATILHIRTNTDGHKTQGVTFPSGQVQKNLLEEVYKEAKVDPAQVSYVEAHGTGTAAGDPQEMNSISEFFCKNRNDGQPLLVGSVKSNMGHSEPTSGLCGIAKIIFMIQEGQIPANLHFKTPNPEIVDLATGKIKVVTENLPWDGGLVGMNGFGFGGSNVHLILKCDPTPATPPEIPAFSDLPVIIPISGRTREAVEFAIKEVTFNPSKHEEVIALYHQIACSNIPGHLFRGLAIRKNATSSDPDTDTSDRNLFEVEIQQQQPTIIESGGHSRRPTWFIFSGVGSQWAGMGQNLMQFKVFHDSIQNSASILKSQGVDLLDILINSSDEDLAQTVLRSAICITSIQIAMVDLLRSLDIYPDGIIGHSVGEVACAYADGCLSAEQTILTAFKRASLIDESSKSREEFQGAMAAVGLSWEEVKERAPPGIYPACHNSLDSVTISGPKKLVTSFVQQLSEEGVFAKEVNSSGQAYHSKYISHLAAPLKEILKGIIVEPKVRSSKWVSSSVFDSASADEGSNPGQGQGHLHVTFDPHLASADYYVNNLVSPVLFQEALKKVPENAVVIEVGPHCLLQAILRRATPSGCTNIGLNHRNSLDNTFHFCNAIGRLYIQGLQPNFSRLYGKVQFPISAAAPSISPLIKWDHSATWNVPDYTKENMTAPSLKATKGETNNVFEISLANPAQEFYKGHRIDQMTLFPATGYLNLVWEYFSRLKKTTQNYLPVIFENVHFHRATVLPQAHEGVVKFHINILEGSGEFEIREGGGVAVSGVIRQAPDYEENSRDGYGYGNDTFFRVTKSAPLPPSTPNCIQLRTNDAYKELRLRGYLYSGLFQGIKCVTLKMDKPSDSGSRVTGHGGQEGHHSETGLWAQLQWNENWPSFLDTLLHFTLFNKPHEALYLPTRFDKLYINPQIFLQSIHSESMHEGHGQPGGQPLTEVSAYYDQDLDTVSCIGIAMQGLHTSWAPRHIHQAPPQLEDYKFTPYFDFDHYKDSNEAKHQLDDKSDSNESESDSEAARAALLLHRNRMVRRKMSFAASGGREKENSALRFCIDVALENTQALYGYEKFKVVEITGGELSSKCLSLPVSDIIHHQPHFTCEFTVFTADENPNSTSPAALGQIPASSEMKVRPLKKGENPGEFVLETQNGYHLVIVHNRSLIDTLVEKMSTRAFLLYHVDRNQERRRRQSGLTPFHPMEVNPNLILVGHKSSGTKLSGGDFYLYRKFDKKMDGEEMGKTIPVKKVIEIDHEDPSFKWVEELKAAMKKAAEDEQENPWKVLLYYQAQGQGTSRTSGILGLVNCLKTEPGGHNIRCFLINKGKNEENARTFDFHNPDAELQDMLARDLLMNVYDGDSGKWGSFRHYQLPYLLKFPYRKVEHAHIAPLIRGDLSSLQWIQSSGLKSPDKNQALVDVYYATLNARDVYWATGEISPDALPQKLAMRDDILGMEFSGRLKSGGSKVMCIVPGQGLATSVQADQVFTWAVPESWTLAEAATVPLAYSMAYYALIIRGQMRSGESILIHYGTGNGSEVTGLCQAAIAISLGHKCTPFIGVKSNKEKEFLKSVFPELVDQNFTTLTQFEAHIIRETGGRGVDLVLNPVLSGEGFSASIRSLTKFGRFLDARNSFEKSAVLEMQARNLSFHHIELNDLFEEGSDDETNLKVAQLLREGIETGVVTPIQNVVFSDDISDVEKAFRFMASKTGDPEKILIRIRDEEGSSKTREEEETESEQEDKKEEPKTVQAIARSYFDPEKHYVIIGGLGGFGLELAGWMIERGARKLVLISRTGITNGYQDMTIRKWRDAGATITISTDDLTDLNGARAFLQSFLGGSIGGIFNLAMVLRDALLENQTPENFQLVCRPKVNATLNLDRLTREMNFDLDYFVVFSSISCGRGTPGQCNYGFANSVMEHICAQRKKDGLSGLAIQWGAIGDVGAVQEGFSGVDDNFVLVGTRPQKLISCLNSLDLLLQQDQPIVGSMVVADKIMSSSSHSGQKGGKRKGGKVAKQSLVRRVMNIMGMDNITNAIIHHSSVTLAEMGMDSLMGIEIKQLIENHENVVFTIANVRKLTLGKLKELDESAGNTTEEEEEDDDDEEQEKSSGAGEISPELVPGETALIPSSVASSPKTCPEPKTVEKRQVEQAQPSAQENSKKVDDQTEETSPTRKFLDILLYPCGFVVLLFIFLAFLLSELLRLISRPIIRHFYGDDLRLMDRPIDGVFTVNKQTSNIVMVLKCEGVPDPQKLVTAFEEKVLDWRPNVTLADGKIVQYPHPIYDGLRWKITHNHLFYCWKRQADFRTEDQFRFDQDEDNKDLDAAIKNAAEYYLQHDWSGEKPQWEVCVISRQSKTPGEFALFLVCHHSYGDGVAMAQILQYAFATRQPPLSISQLEPKNPHGYGRGYLSLPKYQNGTRLEKISIILQELWKTWVVTPHFIIMEASRFYLNAKDCPESAKKVPPSGKKTWQRSCAWVSIDYKKLKSVKLPQTAESGVGPGRQMTSILTPKCKSAPVPLTVVVLTCLSRVYVRLYAEAGQKVPKKLVAWIPYGEYLDTQPAVGLSNNFVPAWNSVPTSAVARDNKELIQKVQASTERSTQPDVLYSMWSIHALFSLLIKPLMPLVNFAPKFAVVYSSVPIHVPPDYSVLNQHKVKSFFGFPPLGMDGQASLSAGIQEDVVNFSLVVDDSLLAHIPGFADKFFPYFEQELDNLIAEFN